MNFVKKIIVPIGSIFGSFLVLHLFGSESWAAEGEGGWRSSYDLIMMWVNFAILAFVLVKFGKNPIKGFFRDQKESIVRTIENIEAEKESNAAQLKQTQELMQESAIRFNAVKEKIIAEGELKKQAIIESARRESQLMINQTNFWIDRQILRAKQRLKSELIDEAIETTLKRLPQAITPEDNQKSINRYLVEIDHLKK
jgi:F-type H+-transporting ATPase subunit b